MFSFYEQKMEVTNVLVVVTRWFGGIQIGNARFIHYVDAAKQVLNDFSGKDSNNAKENNSKKKESKTARRKRKYFGKK